MLAGSRARFQKAVFALEAAFLVSPTGSFPQEDYSSFNFCCSRTRNDLNRAKPRRTASHLFGLFPVPVCSRTMVS